MKAQVLQLRSKLKTSKKGNWSISEHVLQIWAIVDFLLVVGDPISERNQIDAILQGFPKKYHHFIMMIYGKVKLTAIWCWFTYVQEA